jgi:hypothetical protein
MIKKSSAILLIIFTTFFLSACTPAKISSPVSTQNTSSAPHESTNTTTTTKVTNITPTPKSNVTQIELILDDSGSMAGLVGGKSKIDVAKESLGKIIDELKTKENLQVSLRIYGHQNKECTNSVLESPMGTINADLMKSKITDLKPLGSTPIYYSLTESVKDFNKSLSGDKIVVLVTDGLESCNGDPCAAAKALKAGGVVNKMQVVGFGLNKNELGTLQCIVDPFQGQVVGANNSTDFLNAMQQIVEKATNQPNLNISVIGADGKPLQASDICVYPQGQTENQVACAGMFTSEFGFTLKPGSYDLKVINGNTKAETWLKNIEILEGKIVSKIISFAEGTLKVTVVNSAGESTQASDICVYPQGQTENQVACAGMFTSDYTFNLKPGIYDLKVSNYNNNGDLWSKNIEVKASQITTQKISL